MRVFAGECVPYPTSLVDQITQKVKELNALLERGESEGVCTEFQFHKTGFIRGCFQGHTQKIVGNAYILAGTAW